MRELNPSRIAALIEALGHGPARVEPLAGDASTRRYFRASYPDGHSVVCMVYPNGSSGEEQPFLEVQAFLYTLGLPVPQVYANHPEHGLLLVEDLGDNLLETVVERAPESEREELYVAAVDILIRLRRLTDGMRSGCGAFGLAFDEAKLMQEMAFFLTHFVRGLCGTEPSRTASAELDSFFRQICTILAAEPRILAHRDYHSRNLLVQRGRLIMIDFQDARMGPAQYDLASLLRDSYVTVPDALVEKLLGYYFQEAHAGIEDPDRFRYVFDLMSLQRNIKALGTFGYQASVRGATRYLSSIPRTGEYVRRNVDRHPQLKPFAGVLEDHVWGPARAFGQA